ncbi:STAS domain-containing protein [Spirillospora sp. CA-294931]|uniref:STAS domain-containing protein n=1 Tax=Spirillospora sp. CA-294931 TaxID=3240042 RepID=UPI003D8B48ED
MSGLELSEWQSGAVVVLKADGAADVGSADELAHYLTPLSGRRTHVVVDLLGVTFMDSAAASVLVDAAAAIRANGGTMSVARLRTQVAHFFRIDRLDDELTVFNSVEQAVTAAQDSAMRRDSKVHRRAASKRPMRRVSSVRNGRPLFSA